MRRESFGSLQGATLAGLVLAGLMGAHGGARQLEPPQNPARVSGQIASDTGLPLGGATVRLRGSSATVQGAPADANGYFEFSNIPPGRYVLTAVTSGYAVGTLGQRGPTDVPRSFELRAGEHRSSADIQLTPLGAISGRIMDESGAPLAGILVRAIRKRLVTAPQLPAAPSDAESGSAVTDQQGGFLIRNLTTGRYLLVAMPGRWAQTPAAKSSQAEATARQPVPTLYPGATLAEEAQDVRVDLGTVTSNVNFSVQHNRLARISGVVLDSRGRTGNDFVVLPEHSSIRLPITFALETYAEVDSGGRFAVRDLPPGEYRLDVRSKSAWEAVAETGGTISSPRVLAHEFANVSVRVAGDDISDLVVNTGPGFTVSGRLLLDGPASVSLAGIEAAAMSVGDFSITSRFLLSDSTRVRADGTFRLEKLFGSQLIRLRGLPDGYGLKRVRVGGIDVTDEGFDATRDVVDAEVTVAPQTRISGVVTDNRGFAIAGASVIVFAEDRRRREFPDSRYVRSAVSAANGSFMIPGLPAGRYYAAAVPAVVEGRLNEPEALEPLESRATRLTLADGERRALTLRFE